ncbi:unnamed protein product [Closterium sp. Naga37s-1]|nr:unnamed protein product [Closterium sp. Naga37s-1]
MGQVQNTCEKLNARYVEYGVNFAEDSEHLTAFLEAHSHPSKRVVQVEGMDGDGNAVKHTFKLHELDAKKKEDPSGDVESCVSLATLFAKEVIGRLQYRMRSLKSLVGSKLFLPDAYPDGVNKRDRLCAEWFSSLRKMFNAEQCALPDWDNVVKLWRGAKKRRPAKEVSGVATAKRREAETEAAGRQGDREDLAPNTTAQKAPSNDDGEAKRKKAKTHIVDSDSEDEGVDVRATVTLSDNEASGSDSDS